MPLKVTILAKVPGTDNIFKGTGSLTIEGKDCGTTEVLVADLGDNTAQLIVNDDIQPTVLNGHTVKGPIKGASKAEYKAAALKKGAVVTFSNFAFRH
jgi:hypothetical protein